jgi:hypothetical protein
MTGGGAVDTLQDLLDARRNLRVSFRNLLERPGNQMAMHIMADALDDVGACDVATAYRWAAENGMWPTIMHQRLHRGRPLGTGAYRKIYDWYVSGNGGSTPVTCQLPPKIYHAICAIPMEEKKYGGVHRAFVLLAMGLKTADEVKEKRVWGAT